MRRNTPLALASLLATCACGWAQGFDSKDSIRRWSFHNGPEFPGAAGRIEWDGRRGHAAPGCLVLEYSFKGGGNYVQATAPVPEGIQAKAARVWLKKPAGHRITFRAVDRTGQTFQKSVSYDCRDWQQIEVDLTQWPSSYGGPADNKVRPPIRSFGILVENSADPKEGRLLIDDVEFLAEPTPAGTPVTYTALDLAAENAGRLQGKAPAFGRDFSLLGQPLLMRIHVESDGSGRSVRVRLGSHFQSFHRQVGTLSDQKGPQIIEVPLGKLKGWEHSGGANDGAVRLPLRFQRIAIEPGDHQTTGVVRLKRIEVTTLPREGQVVVLVPDVRESGGEVRFSVRAINLRPSPAEGRLKCDVRNFSNSLARQETRLSLGPDGKAAEWSMSHPMGENRFLEALFQWEDDDFVSRPVSIGTCRPPETDGSSELQPDSFMGAGLYLYRYMGVRNYQERVTQVCRLARRAGVKWTREEIKWNSTEPSEGQFDWKFYDDIVEIARDHGISMYCLLCYWSGWADKNTPQGVEQYCRWVRQVVRRYKGRIHHWEIWNEPNIFFWSGPRELYAELLKQAYGAIKDEDPAAVVLGCSTAGIDNSFIRKVMAWGGRFDALTIHPYRSVLDDIGFMQELRDVRQLVGGREVWLTEMGWPSQLIDGVSERRQASLCARAYLCTAASGAGRNVSWYDFRNDGNDPFYNEMNFGLVRNDLRLKPGYGALATIGRLIGQMHVKDRIEVGPDAYAFRFSDGARDTVVVWSPERPGTLSCAVAPGGRLRGAFGQVIQPVRQGEAITLTLDAGFPVFVDGPAGFAFKALPASVVYSVEPAAAQAGLGRKEAVAAVHAGGSVSFRVQGGPVDDIQWELPQGWPQPRKTGESIWEILVPEHTPDYEFSIQAVIQRNGTTVRLPARIAVYPSLIRV